jgi:hypothetical protein
VLGRCLVIACASVGCGSAKHPSAQPATAPSPVKVSYTTTRPCTSIASTDHPLIDLAKAPAKLAKMTKIGPPALAYVFEDGGTIAFENGHQQWFRVTATGSAQQRIDMPVQPQAPVILMPPGLEDSFGQPRSVDDRHLAFVDREQQLMVVDLVASTLLCVAGGVTPGYAVSSDGAYVAYRTKDQLHVADIAQGRDMAIAPLHEARVGIQARAGTGTFIVATLARDALTIYELEPRTGTVTRLIAPVTGWTLPVVADDGLRVLFARGKRPASDADRPPMPHDERPLGQNSSKKPDRDLDRRPRTCDRLRCSGCGWQHDGCGSYTWCGHCPDEPKPPPPAKEDGVYLLAL